jgi:hypothetical protein
MGKPTQSLLNIVDLAGSERKANPYDEPKVVKTKSKKKISDKSPPVSFRELDG